MPAPFRQAPVLRLAALLFLLAHACPAGRADPAPESPSAASPVGVPAGVSVSEGEIDGARFEIATPAIRWNRRLLLIAHGYRPENASRIADLHPERFAPRTLLEEGWVVATTSYRRNGVIVSDAIADIDALRARAIHDCGDPDVVVLLGESLGGLVATIIAEREPGLYDGAVAIDPTLYSKEPNTLVGLSLLPKIPLLLVATQRELVPSRSYMTALVARPDPVVPPALFTIAREGHANVSQRELLEAVHAMDGWIEIGRNTLPKPADGAPYFDATLEPEPGPSAVTALEGGRGFTTRVLEVDAVYGNIVLDAQAGDFVNAGIALMMFFKLQAGAETYRVLYGRDFASARKGEWVGFPNGEGHFMLSRTYGDAARTAHVKPGDLLTVTAYDSPRP